jgi:hypothetical protein
MNNVKELRDSLTENYAQIKAGKMSVEKGNALAKTAGKILNTCKMELQYNESINEKRRIEFLEVPQNLEIKGIVKKLSGKVNTKGVQIPTKDAVTGKLLPKAKYKPVPKAKAKSKKTIKKTTNKRK